MRSPDHDAATGVPLLELARASIEHGLAAGEALHVDCRTLPELLLRHAATFVTLRLDEELRGCCGNLEAVRPLAEDVAHSAFRAAFRDPRLRPSNSLRSGSRSRSCHR
jgi:AMMECR1 domain-containing protein